MTLDMQAKENDDGYQYLQFLVNETDNCDNRKNCNDGDPGNISLSRYMAGFGTGDPRFHIAPTTDLVTQTITATFSVNAVGEKFFKAAIE